MKDIKLSDQEKESFGEFLLFYLFSFLYGDTFEFPKELVNKVKEYMEEDGSIKEENIDKLKPLIEDYYNKVFKKLK